MFLALSNIFEGNAGGGSDEEMEMEQLADNERIEGGKGKGKGKGKEKGKEKNSTFQQLTCFYGTDTSLEKATSKGKKAMQPAEPDTLDTSQQQDGGASGSSSTPLGETPPEGKRKGKQKNGAIFKTLTCFLWR